MQQQSDLVSARLSPKEMEAIEILVGEGFFMNTADFVRMAVREKLEPIKIVDARNLPKEKAQKEIIEYLKDNKKAYPSDIADALQLDFNLVLSIVKDMIKEGRLK